MKDNCYLRELLAHRIDASCTPLRSIKLCSPGKPQHTVCMQHDSSGTIVCCTWGQAWSSIEGQSRVSGQSHRPGLLSAGSKASGRLVAPISTTRPLLSSPSMSANRVDTILL